MKMLWCWRCQMEVPMFDEEEFAVIHTLYGEAFNRIKTRQAKNIDDAFTPLLDYHEKMTGIYIPVPNAIIHHRIAHYGLPCEQCGKPYRTPRASFCAACGNKREAEY